MPYLTPDNPPANSFVCRRIFIPNSLDFLMIVNGALSELTIPKNYEQFGELTPDETVQFMVEMWLKYIESEACMIGMVIPFLNVTVPDGCLECDGAIYDRVDYPELYAVIHPELKIDADTFRVPNLIDRIVMGASGDFGPNPAHQVYGEARVTLSAGEMPEHDHETIPHAHSTIPHAHAEGIAIPTIINGGLEAPAASTTPAASVTGFETVIVNDANVTMLSAGGGESHNNIPPVYTLRYCVVAR